MRDKTTAHRLFWPSGFGPFRTSTQIGRVRIISNQTAFGQLGSSFGPLFLDHFLSGLEGSISVKFRDCFFLTDLCATVMLPKTAQRIS